MIVGMTRFRGDDMKKDDPTNLGISLETVGMPRFSYMVRDKNAVLTEASTAKKPLSSPNGSVLAAATRLTKKHISPRRTAVSAEWQEEAWDMYDQVGEQRFLASTLAGRVAQARLFVGRYDEHGDLIELNEENDTAAVRPILEAFGDNMSGRVQMLHRMAVNLFIAGEGWLVGIPQHIIDRKHEEAVDPSKRPGITPFGVGIDEETEYEGVDLESIVWRFLSNDEVTANAQSDTVTVPIDEAATERIEFDANDLFLIRVWRPHPRRSSEPDSPTRSVLPVLRELVGLTMHISAQIDSRLAGAGILVIPDSAKRAFKEAMGLDADDTSDPFTDALIEAMTTAIADRSSASALVPLVISADDESVDKFQHISFANQLDAAGKELRDEAIRRLALGQDAPPELLLGAGGMNHWGAWLVREDVVTTHIEPVLALIADALTTQYLWPVIEQTMDMDREERERYVVWYDVSHMVVRPNRSDSAMKLYDSGAISDAAVRSATGFDDADAPAVEEQNMDRAVELAMDLVSKAPSLLQAPGLPTLVEQIRQVLQEGDEETAPPVGEPVDNGGDSDEGNIEDGGSGPGQGPNVVDGGEAPN